MNTTEASASGSAFLGASHGRGRRSRAFGEHIVRCKRFSALPLSVRET